jgi:spore coat polysaccharide biosynthesis predicted glycosyltransferase SpsG
MRSLALAEELGGRGAELVFVCDSHTVPWADEQIRSRGIPVEAAVRSPQEHLDLFARLRLDAVVIDSYDLDAEVFTSVRKSGLPTLAIVDGDLRGAEADVFVDQNLGAEMDRPLLPEGSTRLAGLDYVLLRNEILRFRAAAPQQPREHGVPKVFAFFGGTDAFGAGPHAVRALAATGVPFEGLVVAPGEDLAEAIRTVALEPGQHVEVIGPTSELAKAVVASDLVLSASGTSTWELMCLGATAGLVCVVDNQVMGYERAVATGAAIGVGVLPDLKVDPSPAAAVLRRLLLDPVERARVAAAGWNLVDGRGRSRVADALFQLIS